MKAVSQNSNSSECRGRRNKHYRRLQKRYQPNTAHNTFFFILYEMGMEDKDVRRIKGITQEAIRSTRYRILQNTKK